MNFRLTKLKLMWTILITAAIYFLNNFFFNSSGQFVNLLNIFRIDASLNSMITLLIVIFVVYVILSIFQRRKFVKR